MTVLEGSILAMALATAFFVGGHFLMSHPRRGPLQRLVGAERTPFDYSDGLGIHAIVRHPGLWGFALWALGHMLANGDAATVILCGGIALLAFGGMVGIDARKGRDFPEAYPPFVAHTSHIPFAAMLDGRTRFNVAKLGLGRLAIAVVIYFVLLFGHGWFIGRSALPL